MKQIVNTCAAIQPVNAELLPAIQRRLDVLTKPPGSLGRLEEIAIRLGLIQNTTAPHAVRKQVVIMAGDHGVTEEGVSAYPAAVTPQMVANFCAGGAAINVLARHAGAEVLVVDMGVAVPITSPGVLMRKVAPGARNFCRGEAMSAEQAEQAVQHGLQLAHELAANGVDLLAGGEMGIGNTTSAAALTALALNMDADKLDILVGRGTGVDDAALRNKCRVVRTAVQRHSGASSAEPRGVARGLAWLRAVGGFEIAGLTGLILGAAEKRIPFVLDGYIVTAAALVAAEMAPSIREYLLAAHCSAEPGHKLALRQLELKPLLDWDLRLGEGSGAALVLPLVEAATRILAEMATFESAGVSGKI